MLSLAQLAPWALLYAPALAQTVTQVFNFTDHYIDIENSAVRPNGNLLLTTFDAGRLYTLDPSASNPEAQLIGALPGATALCGIAAIGNDRFAVVGGVRGSYMYTNETLYIVDFESATATNATVTPFVQIEDAIMLNGMASLPTNPTIVMIGDARVGGVFRVDTETGDVELVIQDDLLLAPANATVPIGINGVKVHDGAIYFTNTAKSTFGRIPITEEGYQDGDIEILTKLDAAEVALGYDWDDFVIDNVTGVAYTAQPSTVVGMIDLESAEQGVGANNTVLHNPTSLTIGVDGTTLYVTTRGDGSTISGQVVAITDLL